MFVYLYSYTPHACLVPTEVGGGDSNPGPEVVGTTWLVETEPNPLQKQILLPFEPSLQLWVILMRLNEVERSAHNGYYSVVCHPELY